MSFGRGGFMRYMDFFVQYSRWFHVFCKEYSSKLNFVLLHADSFRQKDIFAINQWLINIRHKCDQCFQGKCDHGFVIINFLAEIVCDYWSFMEFSVLIDNENSWYWNICDHIYVRGNWYCIVCGNCLSVVTAWYWIVRDHYLSGVTGIGLACMCPTSCGTTGRRRHGSSGTVVSPTLELRTTSLQI
jgi:hypothetical protein